MHWDHEPRVCLTLIRNLTLTLNLTLTRNLTLTLRSSIKIKIRIKSKKSSAKSEAFRFCACIGAMRNPKRRSGSALQNLAEVRAAEANAPASWSAAVLRRFRWERALGIRAVHRKPSFGFPHVLLRPLTSNESDSAANKVLPTSRLQNFCQVPLPARCRQHPPVQGMDSTSDRQPLRPSGMGDMG